MQTLRWLHASWREDVEGPVTFTNCACVSPHDLLKPMQGD